MITCATYNEQGGWCEESDKKLYEMLDEINGGGIKFALSNVLCNKGKTNEILTEWISKRNYKVIHLNYSYSNSNYHTKNKQNITDEVLILNY